MGFLLLDTEKFAYLKNYIYLCSTINEKDMTPIELFKQEFDKMVDNIPASVDSGAGYVIDKVYEILNSLEDAVPAEHSEKI